MRIIAVIAIIAWAGVASATTCVEKAPEQIAASAEIAFIGTVVNLAESPYKPGELCWDNTSAPKCGGKLGTFRVTEKLRGNVESNVTVLKEDGCYCVGGYWSVGSAYLVVAKPNTTRNPGQLVASNICGGTRELSAEVQPIVNALRGRK